MPYDPYFTTASGLPVAISQMQLRGQSIQRAAAALLFPLNATDTDTLAERVLRVESPPADYQLLAFEK